MTPLDFTYLVDEDFPQVDRSKVTPSVEQVALMERTRCVNQYGDDQGVFNDSTHPTYDEAQGIIAQAVELVLSEIPDYLPESIYPRVLQAAIFKSAILIEASFYKEQYKSGSAEYFETAYEKLVTNLQGIAGGVEGQGKRVDSIMVRSSMAEYEPDYTLPPPRVMPKVPFIIDGSTGDEEGQVDN